MKKIPTTLFLAAPILFFSCSFVLATTFVIRENGVEVGRWDEDDGKDTVEVIENSPVKTPVKEKIKVETTEPMVNARRGAMTQTVIVPEGPLEEWKISGKLVDMISLKRLSGGTVHFKGPQGTVTAAVYPEGGFSARLPAIENGSYEILVEPPPGYTKVPRVLKSGSYTNIPYRERLNGRTALIMYGSNFIQGTHYDMEIGLYTLQSTKKERQDYQRMVRGENV